MAAAASVRWVLGPRVAAGPVAMAGAGHTSRPERIPWSRLGSQNYNYPIFACKKFVDWKYLIINTQ
jgi:hypothetical protein